MQPKKDLVRFYFQFHECSKNECVKDDNQNIHISLVIHLLFIFTYTAYANRFKVICHTFSMMKIIQAFFVLDTKLFIYRLQSIEYRNAI